MGTNTPFIDWQMDNSIYLPPAFKKKNKIPLSFCLWRNKKVRIKIFLQSGKVMAYTKEV